MTWQDAVLSFGGLVLLAGLVQTIVSPYKPSRSVSLLYGVVLAGFGISYYTLGAEFACGVTLAQSVGWFILTAQKRNLV